MSVIDQLRRELTQIETDFRVIILDKQVEILESIVSWPNYVPGIEKQANYRSYFSDLVKNRQFSYRLVSGDILQLYYSLDGDRVVAARCTYAPQPIPGLFESEDDDDSRESPKLSERSAHLRFDFDASADNHSKSHLQFQTIPDLRLPCAFLCMPYFFVDFVARFAATDHHRALAKKQAWKSSLDNYRRVSPTSPIFEERSSYLTF